MQNKISPILISSRGRHESKTLRRLQADVKGSTNNTTTTIYSYYYYYTRVARRKHCKRKHKKKTGAKHHYCNKHIDPNKISADLKANV